MHSVRVSLNAVAPSTVRGTPELPSAGDTFGLTLFVIMGKKARPAATARKRERALRAYGAGALLRWFFCSFFGVKNALLPRGSLYRPRA